MKKSSNQALIKATACLFLAASAMTPLYAAEGTTESLNAQIVQQSITVKGVVKDKTGEPISGANVLEKGTTNGIITDFDGNFQLNANKGDIISVSFIGYTSQELPATAEFMNIIMKDDSEMLNEVVVIGYGGVQKAKTMTASAATVKVGDLAKLPVASMSEGLGGRVTGVITQQGSGAPGENAKIWIRGGENIYPREIEEFLYKMEGIKDVQVAGIPSKRYGEAVGAFIILHEGAEMNEFDVREFCEGKIARYKIPKYIFFIKEFPMTGSGKIQKYKLKDLGLELCAKQGIEII